MLKVKKGTTAKMMINESPDGRTKAPYILSDKGKE